MGVVVLIKEIGCRVSATIGKGSICRDVGNEMLVDGMDGFSRYRRFDFFFSDNRLLI